MTTWILIIAICAGCNSAQTILIQNLPTYEECVRVSKEVMSVVSDTNNGLGPIRKKCIEVKK